MPRRKFGPGDVVELKSGGCSMTVEEIGPDGKATCVWHNKAGKLQRDSFPISALSSPSEIAPDLASFLLEAGRSKKKEAGPS